MLLHPTAAYRFIDGYKAVLLEVLRASGTKSGKDIIKKLSAARSYVKEHPQSLVDAFAALKARGSEVEGDVERAVLSMKVDQWVYLRSTTRHAIFIDSAVKNAYAVRALTNSIDEVAGDSYVTFEAGVFEFMGTYVCDGIILNPVFLGPVYKTQFNTAYSQLRKVGSFHAKPAP
jgi:hypothetical protein